MPFDPTESLLQIGKTVSAIGDDEARKRASGLVSAGDLNGAVGLLTSRGLTDDAKTLATTGLEIQKTQAAQRQAANRVRYGQAAFSSPSESGAMAAPGTVPAAPAAPNYRASAEAAIQGGDLDYGKSMMELADKSDAAQREHLKDVNEHLGQAAIMLGQVPPAQFDGAFEHLKPMFSALGLQGEQIEQLRTQARDPQLRNAFLVQAQGVDKALTRQDQLSKTAFDQQHATDVLSETTRHDRAGEGLEGASLAERVRNDTAMRGIAGGHLALDRQKEAREAASAANPAAKPPTEGQARDGFNAKRIQGAERTISTLEGTGFDASSSAGLSENARKYAAARGEWADSLLRLTTGAAATKQEVAQVQQTYFPQFGDNANVRAAKAAARQRVMGDAVSRAGAGMTSGGGVRRFNPATGRIE